MREVEVKARIKDLEALEAQLKRLSITLGQPVLQDDAIYFDGDKDFNDYQNCNFVRIRRTDNGAYLTLKRSIEDELDSLEHETIVENPEESEKIVKELGLKFGVRVIKHRRQFKMGDITGCIDAVEGLGDFIELEKLVGDDQNLDDVRIELRKKLVELGINLKYEVTQGYDTMVYNEQNHA